MPDQNTGFSKTEHNPILIVGTTPDYVAKINDSYGKPVLFVMDKRFQEHPFLTGVDRSALIFSSLDNFEKTVSSIKYHLKCHSTSPRGVACFDCESLLLAGRVADYFHKPFPPVPAIARARNKFESRRLWLEAGLSTPLAAVASDLAQTLAFFKRLNRTIILKPLSGSGSELVFKCGNETEIEAAVKTLEEQLVKRRTNPFFTDLRSDCGCDPGHDWMAEEYIRGPEYSCDFILDQDRVSLVRETGKIKAANQTFGSVLAYTCPPRYPKGFTYDQLSRSLKEAASALGFSWGYFMTDFIVRKGRIYIIEMTPRPGGDSIPDLVKAACGYDVLGGYLDFMGDRTISGPSLLSVEANGYAGINFFADRAGIISRLDSTSVLADPEVRGLILKKGLGDRVVLPPDNYDDRLLGYCIVNLSSSAWPHTRFQSLQKRLRVSITN